MKKKPWLCYVDYSDFTPGIGYAYFTTHKHPRGDDWDDEPYEYNAETPYERYIYGVIEFHLSDVVEPRYVDKYGDVDLEQINSPWTIEEINERKVPWLRTPTVWIWVGITPSSFLAIVQALGGDAIVIMGKQEEVGAYV